MEMKVTVYGPIFHAIDHGMENVKERTWTKRDELRMNSSRTFPDSIWIQFHKRRHESILSSVKLRHYLQVKLWFEASGISNFDIFSSYISYLLNSS